ncbi:MAG TPA: hypothetical protein VEU50_06705, partial [Archangium sp.]|nr:hypothetical protein [Archangium sp.]
MSSTSTIEAGQALPETTRPRGQRRWHQKPGGWLLTRLDVFLSEPLRRAAPEDVDRCRLLVCIAFVLMLLDVVSLLFLPISSQPWILGPVVLFSLLMNAIALVLLRHRPSHALSGLLICATITATFVFTSFASTNPYTASHAALMLIPAMSVYLVGARPGLLITALVALFVGILHPLHFTTPGVWMADTFAALCVLGIWAVSWLHTSARNQAHAAREQALRTLRESERKLHSLIENTDDLVCSLD